MTINFVFKMIGILALVEIIGVAIGLIVVGVFTLVMRIKDNLEFCPDTITIGCSKCGEIHELKVIKVLSNWMKNKYVVWCGNKHRFDTLWYCHIEGKKPVYVPWHYSKLFSKEK